MNLDQVEEPRVDGKHAAIWCHHVAVMEKRRIDTSETFDLKQCKFMPVHLSGSGSMRSRTMPINSS